jgi:hypothetical protein
LPPHAILARYRTRIFAPKPRLLTEEEYLREGQEMTIKELKKLREFCSSPNCNSWKTVRRLRDPKRYVVIGFAKKC